MPLFPAKKPCRYGPRWNSNLAIKGLISRSTFRSHCSDYQSLRHMLAKQTNLIVQLCAVVKMYEASQNQRGFGQQRGLLGLLLSCPFWSSFAGECAGGTWLDVWRIPAVFAYWHYGATDNGIRMLYLRSNINLQMKVFPGGSMSPQCCSLRVFWKFWQNSASAYSTPGFLFSSYYECVSNTLI